MSFKTKFYSINVLKIRIRNATLLPVMAKTRTYFVCQSCGYRSSKSMGRCPECEQWNTFVEEVIGEEKRTRAPSHVLSALANVDASTFVDLSEPSSLESVAVQPDHRLPTTMVELDRVLGGGIVKGSLVLAAGEPGIGKSTLLLQMAMRIEQNVLYVSGEESLQQIKSRAERLGRRHRHVHVLAETQVQKILAHVMQQRPDVVVIDSIQTLYRDDIESAPGSVAQVRESAALLMHAAKATGVSFFLIGHVTKDGLIAGPKVLEHIVDTVLQFEGDQHHLFRILRATKNRFGSTNEIGIFEMRDNGLTEVANPSELFLAERSPELSGSVVVPIVEGSRVLLVEVQALVTPTTYGMPQRTASGFDMRRLQLLIAVLEKRACIPLGSFDVFVNIAGGLKVDEPAMDLGIALAIASGFREIPIGADTVVVGELGLGGEIRAVSHGDRRVREAAKLGFTRVIVPKSNLKDAGRNAIGVRHLRDAIEAVIGDS